MILEGDKSYGKLGKKRLYKLIPNDPNLPHYLVPYEITQLMFIKIIENKYVCASPPLPSSSSEERDGEKEKERDGEKEKEEKERDPVIATLVHVIGNVSVLANFYEYQLYCKQLQVPITPFYKSMKQSINTNTIETLLSQCEDRTGDHVITIDTPGTEDFDDGCSVCTLPDGRTRLSVYIANVAMWAEVFGAWSHLTDAKVATIYLPNMKKPLIPSNLSELCSLKKDETRLAIIMDIITEKHDDMQSHHVSWSVGKIRVRENYEYEEPRLIRSARYLAIQREMNQLSDTMIEPTDTTSSQRLIHTLMKWTNQQCANILTTRGMGIYRKSTVSTVKSHAFTTACYTNEIGSYVHITSPIRRLVDMANSVYLLHCVCDLHLSDGLQWSDALSCKLDQVNRVYSQIKRVQTQCQLLCDLINDNDANTLYEGVVTSVDVDTTRPTRLFHYCVFIPILKYTTRVICSTELPVNTEAIWTLYMFEDMASFKKKVRGEFVRLGCLDPETIVTTNF
jgi:exoribonuclease R